VRVASLDHLVLTVRDVNRTVDYYTTVLGMTAVSFGGERIALEFGGQKINLHESGRELSPHAANVMPGSADLCFVTDRPIEEWLAHLAGLGIEVVHGPVRQTGAVGPMLSVYVRDPDGNLVEIANYGEV
jgi:catechol 2,3-dioxygenase-like lactoylglutathione lyase family enzyme